jgi:hypothetical protein
MAPLRRLLILASLLATCALRVTAQQLPAPDDSRHGMLREAMLGLLPAGDAVPRAQAKQRCLPLPVDPPNDRLQGPHGDSLLDTRCEIAAYQALGSETPPRWDVARYRWVSIFTAEDTVRGSAARDTVAEEEAVLLEALPGDRVRAVWHSRYETGDHAVWRSITPELGPTVAGATLLSVMSCVNGTGGCSQEFLRRHPDGRWNPVWQVWLDQLPDAGDRIRHGVRIEPATLRGSAGWYGDGDPNCCPSQELVLRLGLQGDSLVLLGHAVRATHQ